MRVLTLVSGVFVLASLAPSVVAGLEFATPSRTTILVPTQPFAPCYLDVASDCGAGAR